MCLGDVIMLVFLGGCGISDWKSCYIPVWLLTLYSVVTVVLAIGWRQENLGSMAAGLALGILFFLGSKATNEEIGYGDSWIITILGLYLGIKKLLWALFLSSMVAGVFSLIILMKNNWKRGQAIPFIPFLFLAYVGVMFL